jgi:hypothetical protein
MFFIGDDSVKENRLFYEQRGIHDIRKEIEKLDLGERASIKFVPMSRKLDPRNDNIWEKSYLMWAELSRKFAFDAEWFVKVDDDTFLMVENLKNYLKYFNPSVPHYLGHVLLHKWGGSNAVFNSGTAYVLSQAALLKVGPVLRNLKYEKTCREKQFPQRRNLFSAPYPACVDRGGREEDLSMSICLRRVGVYPEQTTDEKGGERFLPFHYDGHVKYERSDYEWFWRHKPRLTGSGKNCCVDEHAIISSHPYKGRNADDGRFERLGEKYHRNGLKSLKRNGAIPPAPRLFMYDPESLHFKIDEFRNSLNSPEGQILWKGYDDYFANQRMHVCDM